MTRKSLVFIRQAAGLWVFLIVVFLAASAHGQALVPRVDTNHPVIERLDVMRSSREKSQFYPNGQLKLEIVYLDEGEDFDFREYHVNGQLKATGRLTRGRLDGEYREYYPDGTMLMSMTYTDGQPDGPVKEYYSDGALKKSGEFVHGQLTERFKTYYQNGKIDEEMSFLNGQLHGAYKTYFDSGVMRQEMFFVEGKLNGAARVYDEKGHLQVELQYVDDRREGPYVEYYANRNLRESGTLKDGKLNGLIQIYASDGMLHADMQYADGILHGKSRLYDEHGALREIQTYRNGELVDSIVAPNEFSVVGMPSSVTYVRNFFRSMQRDPGGEKWPIRIIAVLGILTVLVLFVLYRQELRSRRLVLPGEALPRPEEGADSFGMMRPKKEDGPRESPPEAQRRSASEEFSPERFPSFGGDTSNAGPGLGASPFPPVESGRTGRQEGFSHLDDEKELNLLLPESQNLYRRLTETVLNGIFLVNQRGILIYANHAFVSMFGFKTKAEIMGHNIFHEFFNQKERYGDQFLEEMKKQNQVQDFKIKYRTPDGKVAVFAVNANYIWNDKGDIAAIEGVISDRTEQQRLEEQVLKEKYKLEHILEFGEDIDNIRTFEELIRFVTQSTIDILEAERCSVMLEKEDQTLHIVGARGIADDVVAGVRVRLGESISGTVALQGQPLLVRNIEYDDNFRRAKKASYLGRSFMVVPFKIDDTRHGVINVADKRSEIYAAEPFDDTDLRILKTITAKVATAIENVILFTELNLMTVTDPITQIYNYRRFSESLDHEIRRMKRESGDLCVIMMDLDKFKSYNDTFGHVEGDELLRQIGTILKSQLRETDIVCRYAGDEFCIVLPDTTLEGAQNAAEKVKQAVEDFPFKRKMTFSLGIARYKPEMSKQELIVKADQALYEAKHAGRNCIKVVD